MSLTCSCLISYLWSMQRTFRWELLLRSRPRTRSVWSKRHLPSHIPTEDLAWHVGYYTMGGERHFIHSPCSDRKSATVLPRLVSKVPLIWLCGRKRIQIPPRKISVDPLGNVIGLRYTKFIDCFQARTKMRDYNAKSGCLWWQKNI